MDISTIHEVLNHIGNGITDPFWCTLLCGTEVAYKSIHNPEKDKILINEWIGYRLAKAVGLKVPDAGFAYINTDTQINGHLSINKSEYIGIGFYSVKVDKAVQITCSKQITLLENPRDIHKLILFDALIGNFDRNPGNLLLGMKKGDKLLHVFDHSHIFEIGALWDEYQFPHLIRTPLDIVSLLSSNNFLYSFFREAITYSERDFKDCVTEFKKIVTPTLIEDIIDEVPHEIVVNDVEKKLIVEYILKNLGQLEDCIPIIMKGGVE